MATRQKRTKKQTEEHEDAFVAQVFHFQKWAEKNQQLLTVLAIVVAIGIAGLIYYRNYRQSLGDRASQELESVYQAISLQDAEGARGQLVTFLQNFSGTPYEPEARLLLGELYLQDGTPEQAQAVLQPLGASPRDPIEFQAAALLAAAYEEDQQWDRAVEIYLAIADRSDLDFQVRDALEAAARIRGSRGDAAGAIELYERAMDVLEEGDPLEGTYRMRIQELQSGQTD